MSATTPPVRQRARAAPQGQRLGNGRFGPGFCGNPNGRPRKQPDHRPPIDRVLETVVTSAKGGKPALSAEEAFLLKVFKGALEGDPEMIRIAARIILKRIGKSPASMPGDAKAQEPEPDAPLTDAEAEIFARIIANAERTK